MKVLSLFAKKATYRLQGSSKDIPQILIVFGACLGTLMMGVMLTWPSPSIPKLLEPEYNITIGQVSYLTVVDSLAMMVGSPIFAILADKIGRKPIMAFVPLTFITSLGITAFTTNIYVLYLARIFSGLCYASSFSSIPIYVGEITTPKIRSRYGHLLMTTAYAGQFITNLIGLYCDIPHMAGFLLIIPIFAFIVLYFIPETPYYYIMKNNIEKARSSLQILRGIQDVDNEFNTLVVAVQRQLAEPGHFKDLFTDPSNRKALLICNTTRFIQQMSGIITFMAYSQYIFEQAGTHIASGYGAIIFAGMLVVSNTFSNTICDKVGKRLAMVYSCSGVFVALLGETIFFFLQQYTDVDLTMINWFPILGLTIFVLFFCMGQSNVPTLLLGELFSANMKPHGVMFLNMAFALYMGGINKIFQFLMSTFGLCMPFLLFTICAMISSFLSYYLIPETNGKTLEEIQMMLKGTDKDTEKDTP